MKKIKELIAKHKGLSIVTILALVLLLIMIIVFISMFFGGYSNAYGDRLDGIKEVKINKDKIGDVNSSIQEFDEVSKSEARVQGKIVYINITFNEGTKPDKAKEIAAKSLESFSEEELAFYDFSFFLVEEKEEDGFVITGNKHPKVEKIGWIKS